MSAVCPNKSSAEWKELVAKYGEENALIVFVLNNNDLPSVAVAAELLKNLKLEEKDEQFIKSGDHFKLERTVEQMTMLSQMHVSGKITKGQKDAIGKLMLMNLKYQDFLKANIAKRAAGLPTGNSVSVSSVLGNSEFNGDAKKYEAFKLFGTFIHEVIEKLQIEALKPENQGNPSESILTRAFFDKAYDDYMKKSPFHIKDFSKEETFEQIRQVAGIITTEYRKGFLVLPEITVVGETREGTKVVGRLDIVLIDSTGKIDVLDFKTKKVKDLVVYESIQAATGATVTEKRIDHTRAIANIATKMYPVVTKVGFSTDYDKGRSAYDNWTLQLRTYKNMLMQNGFEVGDAKIIALMYQEEEDGLGNPLGNIEGSYVHVFEEENYYNAIKGYNTEPFWLNSEALRLTLDNSTDRIENLKNSVDRSIPRDLNNIPQDEDDDARITVKPIEITILEKQNNELKLSMQRAVDSQLGELNRLKKNAEDTKDADVSLIETYQTRIDSLIRLRSILLKPDNNGALYSRNFQEALTIVREDVAKQWEMVSREMTRVKLERETQKKGYFQLDQKALTVTSKAFNQIKEYADVIITMREIVDDFVESPDSPINSDSGIVRELDNIDTNIRKVEGIFRELSVINGVNFLKQIGKGSYENLSVEAQEMIGLQIKQLEERRERIINRTSASGFQKIKSGVLSILSSDFKTQLQAKMDPANADSMWNEQLKSIEILILKKKTLLNTGFDSSEEALAEYVKAVTKPESLFYIGAQDTFTESSLFQGLMLDSAIASVSNSDRMISAIVQYMKNTEAQARMNAQNSFVTMDFDRLRSNMLNKYSVKELNEKISEIREIEYYDRESGEYKTKQMLYITKPYSESYEKKFRDREIKMRKFQDNIEKLKEEAYTLFGKPEYDDAKKKVLEEMRARDTYQTDHLKWMVENSNTPYIEDFYKLQTLMPADIREKLQFIDEEIEELNWLSGSKAGDVNIDDTTLQSIYELEIQRKKLREEAKEKSLEYAHYVDKMKEFFSYDSDYNLYQRAKDSARTKYSDRPDLYKKWLDMNSVIKPTQEWYDMREALFAEREAIVSGDSVLSDLYESRTKLLKPYKRSGKLDPRFISEEDSQELDAIEGAIGNRINELSMAAQAGVGEKLTKAQKQKLVEIKAKLDAIQTKQMNPLYLKEFKARTKDLQKKKTLLIEAEYKVSKLISEAATKEEIEDAQREFVVVSDTFTFMEKEYEKWYNKNHIRKYKSILDGFVPSENAEPKSFNFENLPSFALWDQYTEEVPTEKYTRRKVKPEMENPGFLKSPDGYPMPKGVIQNPDGSYFVNNLVANSDNVNQKYMELGQDPELLEFYNAMTKLFFGLQNKIHEKKTGYQAPGYAASTVETFADGDSFSEALTKNWKVFQDKTLKLHGSQQDLVNNEFGENSMEGQVRLRNNQQLPLELQSRDVVGAIMKWSTEAHYNIAMAEVAPMMESFIDYLKLLQDDIEKRIQSKPTVTDEFGNKRQVDMRKRFEELQNVIGILEFEKRKFINGQSETSHNQLDKSMKKIVNNIFAYTSFVRIGFDAANQTKNFISGNVQTWISAGNHESNHFTQSDFLWAKQKVYGKNGFFQKYFSDWGKLSDISVETMMYRAFNPMQKDYIKYVHEMTGSKGRRVAAKLANPQELSFMAQDKGDTEIGLTVMYAVLNHYKFKKIIGEDPVTGDKIFETNPDGSFVMVSAHEAYEKNEMGLVRLKNIDFSLEDENRLRNIIYSELRRAQGNYAKSDQTKFEEGIVGKFVYFYRKYLVPQLLNRFGYLRPNWEAGDAALGYWRAVGIATQAFGVKESMKHLVLGGFTDMNKSRWKMGENKMGLVLTNKVSQASRDMWAMMIISVMSMMALAYVKRKEEDDEELGILEGNAIRILWGVKGETLSMFPLGGGSEEYIRNFTTLTTYTRELKQLKNAASHSIALVFMMLLNGGQQPDPDEDSFFMNNLYKEAYYSRKSGPYEAGTAKLYKDFMDMTGLRNFRDLVQPENRVNNMKGQQ
jgi:hypothetical protein